MAHPLGSDADNAQQVLVPSVDTFKTMSDAVVAEVTKALIHNFAIALPAMAESIIARQTVNVLATFRREVLSEVSQPRQLQLAPVVDDPRADNGIMFSRGLKMFFADNNATWRSRMQLQACHLVSRMQEDVAFIAPCDAGKSLVYLLPIKFFDGVTPGQGNGYNIVVVPYVALADSVMRMCRRHSIPCNWWTLDRTELEAVTVVVADTSSTEEFRRVVRRASEEREVSRVIFDEFHTPCTESNFRPVLDRMGWLQEITAPFVYLSATVPPTMEAQIFDKLRAPRPENVLRHYAPRLRARFRVVEAVKDTWADVVNRLILEECPSAEDRTLVFGFSVGDVQSVAKEAGHSTYHGELLQDERADLIDRFTNGDLRVLFATSALAAGVDLPNIRLVIHIGPPPDAIVYEQEIGRGGRNDQPYTAVFVYDPLKGISMRPGCNGGQEFCDMILKNRCMRSIAQYMHGVQVSCSVLGAAHGRDKVAFCDRCQPGLSSRPRSNPHFDHDVRLCSRRTSTVGDSILQLTTGKHGGREDSERPISTFGDASRFAISEVLSDVLRRRAQGHQIPRSRHRNLRGPGQASS